MRFLTAVALALVMLWVPVNGVAQAPDPWEGELFFANDFSGAQYLSWSPDTRSAFVTGWIEGMWYRSAIADVTKPEGTDGYILRLIDDSVWDIIFCFQRSLGGRPGYSFHGIREIVDQYILLNDGTLGIKDLIGQALGRYAADCPHPGQ